MKLAVFFHLGGDIDVLSPFLSPFPGGEIKIIVSEKLLATNHRLSIVLDAYGLEPEEVLSHRSSRDELRNAISDCSHLLTSSESNLNPHRLAFALTQEANHLGLLTATLQHGVENIGLTYFDEYQGPEVRFASQQVLTWNGTRSLLPDVCSETREKVIDVGLPSARPDPAFDELFEAMEFNPEGRKVIGIFENLHWTRYSDDFRRKFLDDLQQATELFPDLLFVTKPHHEGRWLTERFQGDRPENSNLLIIAERRVGTPAADVDARTLRRGPVHQRHTRYGVDQLRNGSRLPVCNINIINHTRRYRGTDLQVTFSQGQKKRPKKAITFLSNALGGQDAD